MKKAFWFSRHAPSEAQLADIEAAGYKLAAVERGRELGALTLTTTEQVMSLIETIRQEMRQHGATRLYGVFPAPVQSMLSVCTEEYAAHHNCPAMNCFASWSVNRAPEGEKPQHQHHAWVPVGHISVAR